MLAYWLEERDKKDVGEGKHVSNFYIPSNDEYKIKRAVIQDKKGNRY